MKRRIRLFHVVPGQDGELDTIYAVAHDETIWICAAGIPSPGGWTQIKSLPDAPDDMRDQMAGAVKRDPPGYGESVSRALGRE